MRWQLLLAPATLSVRNKAQRASQVALRAAAVRGLIAPAEPTVPSNFQFRANLAQLSEISDPAHAHMHAFCFPFHRPLNDGPAEMDHARRANPHHPPGPPLRALLKTLQILIAPGGLPTGAGAATTQRQGASGTGKGTENSAWEIARRGLPVHADVIGKRLAAAGLCLKESLCEGDAGRNGSVTRDGERARGDSGNDVSDGVRGGAGGEVDGSGEYGGVVPNKELGLQTGGGGPPAYSSACSDTDNESDTGQSTPIPDLLVNAISLKTLLPLAFPIVPPSLPTFTSAPTATTPSSSSLDAAGPPIQSELPPHLSYSNGRPGPNTDQTHGTPEWSQARDKYQAMLGVAAIRVLVRMQAWLALEVGPGEGRAGLGVPDCELPV